MKRDTFARPRLTQAAVQLLLLLWFSSPLQAEETLPDVRLLIDVSGSMRESDPNNLRAPALELMLRLLPEGSRAGVWTFGQWVNMPVAHREVDEQWREQASLAVAQINNHGLLTNIPDALELATYDARRLDYHYKTSVILLTDGKVEVSDDPARNARAARDVLDKLALELRDTGIEVHTIALSDNADHEFLRQLAQITGGLAEQAETADELSAVFLQALDIAAPTEQVPLLGGEFLIDDSVEEFTALVFPEPGGGEVTVIDPGQNMYTAAQRPPAVRWFQHQGFQLITVVNPAAGEWRIAAPGAQTRVNVISHLTVSLDGPPTSLESGHSPELGIRLMDSAQVIRDPDLLGLVNIVARVSRGDTEHWEIQVPTAQVPGSGEYRIALPMLSDVGRYEIVVEVDGGSFQREQVLVTDVFEPRPRVEIVPPTVAEPAGPGAWLLPAVVTGLLLLALAVWWLRQRREPEWEEEWEEEDDLYHDDDEEFAENEYAEESEIDYEEDYDEDYAEESDGDYEEDYDEDSEGREEDADDDELLRGLSSTDPERRQ